MKAHLIYSDFEAARNAWYIEQLISECASRGAGLTLLIEDRLEQCIRGGELMLRYDGAFLPAPDFAICRTQNPPLSRFYEQMGVPVFNSSHVSSICNDKFSTYRLAASLGVHVLDTCCVSHKLAEPEYPFVLKPLDGKGGRDVYLVTNADEYAAAFERMMGRPHIMQRVADVRGRDTRFYVLGGRVIAAYTRISRGDFRSNFCLGGSAAAHEPTRAELDIINAIYESLKPDFVGIDIMYDGGRPVLNEVEDVVGARMVYANSDINVAGLYIEHILKRI